MAIQQNVMAELRATYSFLTRVERVIAGWILDRPREFTGCSMEELAEKIGVSQGSIHNFSKKFAGGGFSSLKLAVAACLSEIEEKEEQGSEPYTVIDKSRGVKAALEQRAKQHAAMVTNTLAVNDEPSLRRAVDLLLAARKIDIYGLYHSGIVAQDFSYQLIQLGIPATRVNDALMCGVSASMLSDQDVVVAISASGRTKEVLEAVDIAKSNRVPVIAVTGDRRSPLASRADAILLAAASGMAVSDRTQDMRMAQLLVLDALCAYIRTTVERGSRDNYDKLWSVINTYLIEK